MSPGVTIGFPFVIGIQDPKPIGNLPHDLVRLKLRFRNTFATAFVFTPGCVTEWYLRDEGDLWYLAMKRAENRRLYPRRDHPFSLGGHVPQRLFEDHVPRT